MDSDCGDCEYYSDSVLILRYFMLITLIFLHLAFAYSIQVF